MEGGDIVYIILMVIFLLSGLFKKNKKANQKRTAQTMSIPTVSEPEEEADDYWFASEEKPEFIHEETNFGTPPPPPVYQSDKDAAEHAHIHAKVSKQVKSKNKKQKTIDDALTTATVKAHEQIELNTAEDARRAFIYSEIFQRKY